MLSSICNLMGVCEPNYRHSPRPSYEESLEANTSHGTSPRPPEDETCAVSRTPAHVESDVTTKSDTIPGSGVIKSITTDTVTITPQLKHPLEPGGLATLQAPRDSVRYSVELTTGVKVTPAVQGGITISRPGQKDIEVPHTSMCLYPDPGGGIIELYSDYGRVREFVRADGSIRLHLEHVRPSNSEDHFEIQIARDGKIKTEGWLILSDDGRPPLPPLSITTYDENELKASEEPDGTIKLKTSCDDYLVMQPYLTRRDVNG